MANFTWDRVFEQADRRAPAASDWLGAVNEAVSTPLLAGERQQLEAEAAPDLSAWTFPTHPLPPSYLSFLAWSDGGLFVNGDRELNMLSAPEVREYMLTYRLPYHMPETAPFALNGAGYLYLFDLRNPPGPDGEYPVLFVDAGNLGFDKAVVVAASFLDVCQGRTNPADTLPPSQHS
jgi:hypothetical protein